MKLTIFQLSYIKFQRFYRVSSLFIFLCCLGSLEAQTIVTNRDLTEPLSSSADALCGPVEIITLCTHEPDSLAVFFEQGWGLRKQGPFRLSKNERKKLALHWNLPADAGFQCMYFDRPNAPGTILIRVLVFDKKMPMIRSDYGPTENGPFTIGFPNARQEEMHKKLSAMGYSTLAPLQAAMLNKPDGSQYKYLETIYKGPEWLLAVGIERGNGMPQLSNIDSATGLGGPGYSAMNVTGMSDSVIGFLINVLGYELRRDQVWTTGKGSALGVPAGIPFRFAIAYAKGAKSGHLILMDFQKNKPVSPANPPHLPYRGIGMYSVSTQQLDEVLSRAIQAGIHIVAGPGKCKDPVIGSYKNIVLMAPNQVYIEVMERKN